MDATTLAIGDIVLIPLIIGLVQAFKRFAPNASNDIWFGVAMVLGLVLQILVFMIAHGQSFVGWDMQTWVLGVTTGLSFGLATGKAYDKLSENPTTRSIVRVGQPQ